MATSRVSRMLVAAQYVADTQGKLGSADVLSAVQMVTQYTGNVWTIASDDGQTLTLQEFNPSTGQTATWPVQLNQWVVVGTDFGILARMSPAAFQARYTTFDAIFGDAAHAVGCVTQQEVGTGALPSLLLNGTATVAVTLSGSFPSNVYQVRFRAISGAAILSQIQVTGYTLAAGSLSVQVRANGLASVAGILLVDAWRTA